MRNKIITWLLRLNHTPRDIALGFALGLFIGMSPFFGLHTFSAIFFSTILRWSRISALAGIQITNIFTIPFIYPVIFKVGRHFYPIRSSFSFSRDVCLNNFWDLLQTVPDVMIALVIGGVVLGMPMAVISYFPVYHLTKHIKAINRSDSRNCGNHFFSSAGKNIRPEKEQP